MIGPSEGIAGPSIETRELTVETATLALARDPKLVIITIGKDLRPASAPSGDRFEHLDATFRTEDQVWDFYRLK